MIVLKAAVLFKWFSGRLFSDDFYEDTFFPFSVEFVVEDLLPRAAPEYLTVVGRVAISEDSD